MPTPPRRWFAFRLRTLLVVVALLSVPLAWVAYQLNWIRERHEFLLTHRAAWVFVRGPRATWDINPPWPLQFFGERGNAAVILPKCDGPEDHASARALFPEATISQKIQ